MFPYPCLRAPIILSLGIDDRINDQRFRYRLRDHLASGSVISSTWFVRTIGRFGHFLSRADRRRSGDSSEWQWHDDVRPTTATTVIIIRGTEVAGAVTGSSCDTGRCRSLDAACTVQLSGALGSCPTGDGTAVIKIGDQVAQVQQHAECQRTKHSTVISKSPQDATIRRDNAISTIDVKNVFTFFILK